VRPEKCLVATCFVICVTYAQPSFAACGPLRECAQQAVDLAAETKAQVASLQNQLEEERVVFESGYINIEKDTDRGPEDGTTCNKEDLRGKLNGHVTFKKKYKTTPDVMAGISGIQIAGDYNRLRFNVTKITPEGFDYQFYTWCHTQVIEATASYVVIGKGV